MFPISIALFHLAHGVKYECERNGEYLRTCGVICQHKGSICQIDAYDAFYADSLDDWNIKGMSILDYLNEDCWRAVLSYLPVRDVMRTERASRRWQQVVLTYLQGIRIGIKETNSYVFLRLRNVHWLNVNKIDLPSFELWSNKLGGSVVSAYCDSEQSLITIGKHCPNIKAVTFNELTEHLLSMSGVFKKLEEIFFFNCDITDDCVSKYLANTDVKKLELWINSELTGQCFRDRSANMKQLVFYDCKALHLHQLLAADFRHLTEFELYFAPLEITRNIRSLLRNMPNLVVLEVSDDEFKCEEFFGAVCELSRLEFLYASFATYDEDFVAVARSCGRLRALALDHCSFVTGRGLGVACACAGARLEWLGIADADVTDAEVEAAVRACPNLAWLDVRWCDRLTPALLPRAAAARRDVRARRPLRIIVSYTDLYGAEEQKELILVEDPPCTEVIKFELSLYISVLLPTRLNSVRKFGDDR